MRQWIGATRPMGWIDCNNREARTELARAGKAWIEYYIQDRQATSLLRLAFFSMDARLRSPDNATLEYQLVYKMTFWGVLGTFGTLSHCGRLIHRRRARAARPSARNTSRALRAARYRSRPVLPRPALRSGSPKCPPLPRRRPSAASDTCASARHSPAASIPPATLRRAPATPPDRTGHGP